jgi:type IV fimbrial biogenesis protein FimT
MLRRQDGISLIESMIAIVIMSLLIAVGGPSFGTWLKNTQIRGGADAIQAGLQQARAEAVQRNMPVRFTLTNTLADDCAASASGTNWVVSLDDPTNKCASAVDGAVDGAAPRVIAKRAGKDGSAVALVAADQASIVFNGLGRAANVAGTAAFCVGSDAVGVACNGAGPLRQLKVTVTQGGQIRMCNPAMPAGDAQGC